MMHPDTRIEFINEEIGYGVVASKFIPKGTITWVQDELDQVFSPQQVSAMQEINRQMMDKYSFRNNKGNYILCWDLAKYVNHSFKSNCLSTAYDFEIAVRDIQQGEQLTDDYGYLNVDEPFVAIDEGVGRTVVYPDDLFTFHKEWDLEIKKSFRHLKDVEQPLISLIPKTVLKKLEEIMDGRRKMDSIINLYYQRG